MWGEVGANRSCSFSGMEETEDGLARETNGESLYRRGGGDEGGRGRGMVRGERQGEGSVEKQG